MKNRKSSEDYNPDALRVIEKFGGSSALYVFCNGRWSYPTVNRWKFYGIPVSHWRPILEIANAHNIDLVLSDFIQPRDGKKKMTKLSKTAR